VALKSVTRASSRRGAAAGKARKYRGLFAVLQIRICHAGEGGGRVGREGRKEGKDRKDGKEGKEGKRRSK
jgi:hypothetical protein